jgi:hypothetical protein
MKPKGAEITENATYTLDGEIVAVINPFFLTKEIAAAIHASMEQKSAERVALLRGEKH